MTCTCNKDKSQELEKKIQELENNKKDPGKELYELSLYTNILSAVKCLSFLW